MVLCYAVGAWAMWDTGNPFGAIAVMFIPVLCLLLIFGLARGWLKAAWL